MNPRVTWNPTDGYLAWHGDICLGEAASAAEAWALALASLRAMADNARLVVRCTGGVMTLSDGSVWLVTGGRAELVRPADRYNVGPVVAEISRALVRRRAA